MESEFNKVPVPWRWRRVIYFYLHQHALRRRPNTPRLSQWDGDVDDRPYLQVGDECCRDTKNGFYFLTAANTKNYFSWEGFEHKVQDHDARLLFSGTTVHTAFSSSLEA